MLRSMYSGISGMRVNQTKLDVVGNNIANVGTTAFKGSRVRFQDMLSQSMSEAIGPGRNQGGVNPKQVGLGVQLAGIDTLMSQGMMQPTGRNLDVGVDGEGYFIVGRGAIPESNAAGIKVDPNEHSMNGNGMQVSFTRDGSFTLDHRGNLLTSDGYRVLGYAVTLKDANGNNLGPNSIEYSANGNCNFVDVDSENGIKATDNLVPLRIPEAIYVRATVLNNNGDATTNTKLNYTGTVDATSDKDKFPTIGIDGEGNKFRGPQDVKIEIKWVKNSDDPTKGTFNVFVNGKDYGKANEFNNKTDVNSAEKDQGLCEILGNTKLNIDASKLPTSESAPAITDEQKKYSWSYALTAEGDKKVTSFSIEKDGVIKATLDDGKVTALGQIAMASFRNTAGLKKMGKNMYQNTANSGEPNIRSGIGGNPVVDNSDGYGDMMQGMLEMSNIDLAEQFTDMIVASRAFQASGKMITTGDEILQDIINLKR
ncbi:flagellar hook protein FlgE [Haloimpatiens lingqiaonensis]|uniref:flagellar hook protein FlgE n=1 Tax=Haloimpatiens lingqiaonensis TaxID=1380675 RepID=UPI0010FD4F5F|nr:flagellar hook-basal body complex protein [Haloimpatiens lingqiaonensis]